MKYVELCSYIIELSTCNVKPILKLLRVLSVTHSGILVCTDKVVMRIQEEALNLLCQCIVHAWRKNIDGVQFIGKYFNGVWIGTNDVVIRSNDW